MKISATILLKDNPRHLRAVVSALHSLDEVLVYSNGADVAALTMLGEFLNVRIVVGEFFGFGQTHNYASDHAKNDWILSIDSDEIASDGLVAEIQTLILNEKTIYTIPRRNIYNGQWIKGCGWWPDYALRLYNKKYTRFSNAMVHESIETRGMQVEKLKNYLEHHSYDSISDFLTKMQSYSDLFANEWAGKKKSSPLKAFLHGTFAFFKSYILKGGIWDGYAGYLISSYNGHTSFYKYMKLYEANLRIPK